MSLEKEALTHKIEDDLAARNRNWDKLTSHLADYESLLAGGQMFTATLQNGWTGNLNYSKNDLGQIWVRGNITSGTVDVGTTVAVLPDGYRPASPVSILAWDGSRGRLVLFGVVLTNGIIQIRNNSDGILELVSGSAHRINLLFQ